MSIAEAAAALAHGDDEAALAHLLAAWNAHRSTLLAHVIDLLDLCVHGLAPPAIATVNGADLLAATPLERGRLLRQLALPEANAWLHAVPALPPDPRVVPILLLLDSLRPYPDDEDDIEPPVDPLFRAACAAHHDTRIDALSLGEPPLPHALDLLPDDDVPALQALERALRRRLFDDGADQRAVADFAASPRDLQARTAYADWLTARGDPRGAFLRGGDRPTRRDLDLPTVWLGPLGRTATALLQDGVVDTVRFHDGTDKALPDPDWQALELGWRPGWATVTTLDDAPASLLATTRLPALHTLGCSRKDLELALQKAPSFPALERLSLHRWYGPDDEPTVADTRRVQTLLRTPSLRGLPHLKLHAFSSNRRGIDAVIEALGPLLADPCGLTTLTVRAIANQWFWSSGAAWFTALRAHASPLRTFRAVGDAGERWIFGADVRVEWWTRDPNLHTAERVGEAVAAGARRIHLVTVREVAPALRERLASFPCELTIEVDPTLELDRR